MDVVTAIEGVKTYTNDHPIPNIYISASGQIELTEPYDIYIGENE